MADYFLGTASDAAQAQLQQLQQYAQQLQPQVFDASVAHRCWEQLNSNFYVAR